MFQRVKTEVQKIIEEFKAKLFALLEDTTLSLEDAQQNIRLLLNMWWKLMMWRLLLELRATKDPAWHYLSCSHDHLCQIFAEKTASKKPISEHPTWSMNPPIVAAPRGNGKRTEKLIKEISAVLLANLPEHYKLTEMVLGGQFKVMQYGIILIANRILDKKWSSYWPQTITPLMQ